MSSKGQSETPADVRPAIRARIIQIQGENAVVRAIVPVTTTIRAPAKSMARSPILKLYFLFLFRRPVFHGFHIAADHTSYFSIKAAPNFPLV